MMKEDRDAFMTKRIEALAKPKTEHEHHHAKEPIPDVYTYMVQLGVIRPDEAPFPIE